MISVFSHFGGRDLRPNPHSMWVGRDLSRLSLRQKEVIAEAIGDLEYQVWGSIAPHFDLKNKDSWQKGLSMITGLIDEFEKAI